MAFAVGQERTVLNYLFFYLQNTILCDLEPVSTIAEPSFIKNTQKIFTVNILATALHFWKSNYIQIISVISLPNSMSKMSKI